jgi:PHD/YefM family antitoxin component YafN of YafNO toxin-antitoxin module
LIKAIKAMKKKERDAFLEDLLAATSPVYLESIREARADYKAGRIKTHKEVFGG